MTENNGTEPAGTDWQVNVERSRDAGDTLREALAAIEKLAGENVEIGECIVALRVVENGVEVPLVYASRGSPMVLSSLADWLDCVTSALSKRAWWARIGLPE